MSALIEPYTPACMFLHNFSVFLYVGLEIHIRRQIALLQLFNAVSNEFNCSACGVLYSGAY